MKTLKTSLATAIAGIIISMVPSHLNAQMGIKRTQLQRHDLSVNGHEVVQVRVDFEPGTAFGMHNHRARKLLMFWKAHWSL